LKHSNYGIVFFNVLSVGIFCAYVSNGRIFGYVRVSSTEQNLDRQLAELVKYVTEENIVTDKQSGKDLERGGYQALKGRFGLRRGDTYTS